MKKAFSILFCLHMLAVVYGQNDSLIEIKELTLGSSPQFYYNNHSERLTIFGLVPKAIMLNQNLKQDFYGHIPHNLYTSSAVSTGGGFMPISSEVGYPLTLHHHINFLIFLCLQ